MGFAIICFIVTVMLDILLHFVNHHEYHQEEVLITGFGIGEVSISMSVLRRAFCHHRKMVYIVTDYVSIKYLTYG